MKDAPGNVDAAIRNGKVDAEPSRPPRLLIDVSEVVNTDYGTGIHRVVRNLARALLRNADSAKWSSVAVAHTPDGAMRDAHDYAERVLGVVAPSATAIGPHLPGDTLLLLDSAWEHPERFLADIQALQEAGGRAGALVYDLIPLRFPQYCVDFMPPIFERWLRFVVHHCDFLVCISRSVADDLAAWIQQSGTYVRAGLRIGHIHLGAEIGESAAPLPPSLRTVEAMAGARSVLMVGTIEPRKRHDVALAAFELAWGSGSELRMVIMGRQGWHVEELVQTICGHRELGSRLFWIDSPGDSDLQHAYRAARCLLQASDAEGFGLPLVEAANYSAPLLLSDIPVFHEIAGAYADYFAAGDPQALSNWLLPGAPQPRPSYSGLAITWVDSAGRLLELMAGREWDHQFP